MRLARFAAPVVLLALAACSTVRSPDPGPFQQPSRAEREPVTVQGGLKRGGGYYKDDGPGDNPPSNLEAIPDAEPRAEPLHRFANRPYEVFGKQYVPMTSLEPFQQRGLGSWYGRRYHGQKTSIGERYDMYGMTAAHPTLPLPSYARVTNLANGRSVVVRLNDRGPFHAGRVVDLSYAAAYKLGYVEKGSALVEVQSILPEAPAVVARAAADSQPSARALAPVQPAPQRAAAAPVSQPASEAAPQPAGAPPVLAAAAQPAGVYLQLGAFSDPGNAESFRDRLHSRLDWIRETVYIQASGALQKLQLGPYRDRAEAGKVADRIQSELNFKPFIVIR